MTTQPARSDSGTSRRTVVEVDRFGASYDGLAGVPAQLRLPPGRWVFDQHLDSDGGIIWVHREEEAPDA